MSLNNNSKEFRMSAISDITLNDGADTPVATTFSVMTKEGLNAEWADTSDGVPVGFPTVTLRMRRSNGNQVRKVAVKVVQPVLKEAAASQSTGFIPAPEVQGYVSVHTEILIPENIPEAATKDALAFAAGALQEAFVKNAAISGQFPY
jgi:hypothetical protein